MMEARLIVILVLGVGALVVGTGACLAVHAHSVRRQWALRNAQYGPVAGLNTGPAARKPRPGGFTEK
jgi:hypothetical protein